MTYKATCIPGIVQYAVHVYLYSICLYHIQYSTGTTAIRYPSIVHMTYVIQSKVDIILYSYRRFRNNRFWHHFSFVFMTWSFSLLRKNSIDFFLQFSSIYLSILKLLQFSLNFFNLLQFTSCSKFLSPIFSFFLTSHSCLMFNFVEKNLTNGSHPRQPMSSTVPP